MEASSVSTSASASAPLAAYVAAGGQSSRGATISDGARAAAEAAIAAAKEAATMGMSRGYNKVAMTDTRRFAGKDIQVGGLERCVWTLLWKGVQDKRGVRSSQEGECE